MGEEPRRPGAELPEHRIRRRVRDAGRGDRRVGVGELAVVAQLRDGVDDRALDPHREHGNRRRPPHLGQRRADDAVLPGGGPRGQAPARSRGATRATPARDPGVRGDRRRDRAGRDLPGVQRRPGGRTWLGRGDVERHGVRAGGGGAGDPADRDANPGVPAFARGGRRPHGAGRDRDRLHDTRLGARSQRRGRPVRGAGRVALCPVRPRRDLGRRGDRASGSRCSSPASTR